MEPTLRYRAKYVPRIVAVLSLAIFGAAIWFLHRELTDLRFGDIQAELGEIEAGRILAAIMFAIGGYATLTAYDALAIRYVRKSIPYARSALTAFMAFAVGNNVGIAALSGGPIRYRMYSALGLSGVEIAKVIFFCTTTFVLGASFLLGASLWLIPVQELALLGLPTMLALTAGAVMFVLAIAYVVLPLVRKSPIGIANWQIDIPPIRITVAQSVVSMLDLVLASATLYVLMAPDIEVSFLAFLGVYAVAISAGLLSNIPGGIGVFEAVMLLAFPDVGRDVLLGSIVVYRLIYFIGPLVIALAIMGIHEAIAHRKPLTAVGGRIADGLSAVAPQVVSTIVFLSGVVLLVSGASPAVESRLRIISSLLPHAMLEISHLAGSLIGLSLLVVARGLNRRLRGAYRIVSGLLLTGAVVSLLKGFDYEEAIILILAFALLWAARDEFHRQGSVIDQRFSAHWIAVIAIAVVGAAWVGIASYRHIPYSNELWWQFSLDGDAPRMLRALLLVSVAALAFSIAKLIRPAAPMMKENSRDERVVVERIVGQSRVAIANAALLGDKRFLFNPARTAFIMYQVSGRSWVALGDPVGPEAEREALIWRFRELCDQYDAWPVFYEISEASLPMYIDMGLTLSKLGEEGLVPLGEFSLEGKERADLRQALHRAERSGATFAVATKDRIPPLIPKLKAISDDWLVQKGAAEKGFSLGRFSPEYITNFDCALVTVKDEIVAFANLWPAPVGGQLSIDLMRHSTDAPKGVMDYLFTELLIWSKAHDYAWFSLGMAPLSGLEQHPLAPLWHRVGNLVFRHAEDFYNFEGLRKYKEKFAPVWFPRYLASPGGLTLPRVFLDSSILVSGGLSKIVRH